MTLSTIALAAARAASAATPQFFVAHDATLARGRLRVTCFMAGAIVLAGITTPALAAKFTMQLTPSSEQTARMEGGVGAVDDHSTGSSVRFVQVEGHLKKRGSVSLIVMNHGEQPFNFGPENVTATLSDGTSVEIITYERLAREEKKRQTWAAVAAGLAAASNSMNAANAGRYSGTGTYSGSTYGSFGGAPYRSSTTGMATVSGYDAGRAQIAQSIANQQNQASFARMAEQNASNAKGLKSYMRTTTVDPGQMFGGSVIIELPKSIHRQKGDVPVTFFVSVNGQEHKFSGILKQR